MHFIYRCLIFVLTAIIFISLHSLHHWHLENATRMNDVSNNYITIIWLTSFPIAVCLWLGWICFLEKVPWTISNKTMFLKEKVFIRYVTRGHNVDAINHSVQATFNVLKATNLADTVHIQVISDRLIKLPLFVELIIVPHDFETPEKSLFKAKALYYAQIHYPLDENQWVLYLDEESRMTHSSLQGVVQFIDRHHQEKLAPIGQGPIIYTGEHWFWCGADALRLADDLGRFKLQYSLGVPIFGVHGSYLLLRGDVDRALSFDVGEENSLTEDTAWALLAWQKGYRFRWINGFILEQPPANLKDFLKQRQRWLCGMKMVIKSPKIQSRFKLIVTIFTYLWQASFLSICLSIFILLSGIHTPDIIKILTDFTISVYFSSYFIGNLVTCYITRRPWIMLTSFLYPIYGLLESLATLIALRRVKSFYVVKKI